MGAHVVCPLRPPPAHLLDCSSRPTLVPVTLGSALPQDLCPSQVFSLESLHTAGSSALFWSPCSFLAKAAASSTRKIPITFIYTQGIYGHVQFLTYLHLLSVTPN